MTMIDGVNDSLDEARRVVELFRGWPFGVRFNLIPWNRIEGSAWSRSPMERVLTFQQHLRAAGHVALIRKTRGEETASACGQLAVLSR